jgi:hypothetical protein
MAMRHIYFTTYDFAAAVPNRTLAFLEEHVK